MAAPPTPQPFHLAASGLLKRPLCSTQGIAPWRLPAPRADGSDMNDVTCVRIYDATRVSDVYDQTRPSTKDELVSLRMADWQPGQAMPPIVAVEADCNLGKSHWAFVKCIRPMLLANPKLPMLFFSVRITHAYDLSGTLRNYFVDDDNRPIDGMQLMCYKEGEAGVKERCMNSSQLVISPQTAALERSTASATCIASRAACSSSTRRSPSR